MRRLARHLEQRRQRGDERRCAHKFDHRGHAKVFGDFPNFPHVLSTGPVVVQCEFLSGRSWSISSAES
jgi:hypothetical protein